MASVPPLPVPPLGGGAGGFETGTQAGGGSAGGGGGHFHGGVGGGFLAERRGRVGRVGADERVFRRGRGHAVPVVEPCAGDRQAHVLEEDFVAPDLVVLGVGAREVELKLGDFVS